MGYFKQQLISEQVEVGDRVPAPKPASEHVALQTPYTYTKQSRSFTGWALVIFALSFGLALIVSVI